MYVYRRHVDGMQFDRFLLIVIFFVNLLENASVGFANCYFVDMCMMYLYLHYVYA